MFALMKCLLPLLVFSSAVRAVHIARKKLAKAELFSKVVAAGITVDDGGAEAIATMLAGIDDHQDVLAEPFTLLRIYFEAKNDTARGIESFRKLANYRSHYPGQLRQLMIDGMGADYYTSNLSRSVEGCHKFYDAKPLTREGDMIRKYGCWGRAGFTSKGEPVMLVAVNAATKNGMMEWGNRGLMIRALTFFGEDLFQCARALSVEKKELVMSHIVFDMEGIGLEHLKLISRLRTMKNIKSHYHPGYFIRSSVVINAPWAFTLLYKALDPLMTARGREIFKIYGDDYKTKLMDDFGVTVPNSVGEADGRQCLDEGELTEHNEDEKYNNMYWDREASL